MRMRPGERLVLGVQGTYFLVTGLWPLVHYRSFEAVTGPKRDDWVVKTLGALIVPVGAALTLGVRRARPTDETRLLAVGSSLALGTADVVFVAQGRIARVYLADAVAQALLMLGLLLARRNRAAAIVEVDLR